jgi:hypothetical protein
MKKKQTKANIYKRLILLCFLFVKTYFQKNSFVSFAVKKTKTL